MISFIGTGNMGSSIIRCLAKSGVFKPQDIGVYDINKESLSALCCSTGCVAFDSAKDVANAGDMVVLCVKPNVVDIVLSEIADEFASDNSKLLVSIAAGIPIEKYEKWLGSEAKIVRTMPNMPAQVGEGMTIVCANKNVTDAESDAVIDLFNQCGSVEVMDEKFLNSVIALTSSSPAYVFMMLEAMADAACQAGIPRDKAYKMAAKAVQGSAALAFETGVHPGELKDAVCSPGGTTIEAVNELEAKGFRNAIISAMNACTDKANELGAK